METKNPVRIVCQNIIINKPKDCFKLPTPFKIVTNFVIIDILEGYTPVYFKRVTMKICGNKQEIYSIKYRIGYRDKNNKETGIWVDESGRQIKE